MAGEGFVTAEMDGYVFEQVPRAQTLHLPLVAHGGAAALRSEPDRRIGSTRKPACPRFRVYFDGSLSARDKSVFQEVVYEQNDFFSLNDMFLREHKERWTKTMGLYLLPVALEMPGGVIDDFVNFMIEKDILISLIE